MQRIGSDLIDRSAIDRCNSHRDYRSGLENSMSCRANQRINWRSLILLHVEENEIRVRRIHADVELLQEIRLHEVKRRDEECAEAERQDNGSGLVRGTIQI